MSRFFNLALDFLAPYVPGEQPKKKMIKLNTNESPYPPAPGVEDILKGCKEDLNLYPDPEAVELRNALAKYYNLKTENIAVSNGSDEMLAFSYLAFGNIARGFAFCDVTYAFYKVFAELFGVPYKQIPLKDDYSLCLDDFADLKQTLLIANPNAPTGLAVPLTEIEKLLQKDKNRLVIVDEAYACFGAESAVELTKLYDNLLVISTFSKNRALAGARLGMAFAQEDILADIKKIQYSFNPYNVNRMTQLCGLASLSDEDYFRTCCQKIIDTRQKAAEALQKLGCTVLPSLTNFLFVAAPHISGADFAAALREKGILVRYFPGERTKDFVRISIGTDEDMQELVKAAQAITANAAERR